MALSIASLISFTPDKTADIEINSDSIVFAITLAIVVLPTPGGPHRIIDGNLFDSIATLRDWPSPNISS